MGIDPLPLIIAPNYHKTKLGVTLYEVLEIHRDSYLCRICDMTFLKMSENSGIGIFLLIA